MSGSDFTLRAAFHLPGGERSELGRPRDVPLLAQVGSRADHELIRNPDAGAGHDDAHLALTRGVPYRRRYFVRGESLSGQYGAWISWGQPPRPATPDTLGLPKNLAGWPLRVELTADRAHNGLAAYGPRLLVLRDGHGTARARETDLTDAGPIVNAVFCGPERLITVSRRSEGDWAIDELRCWRREGDLLVPGSARKSGLHFWHLVALPAWDVVIAGGQWFAADTLQEIEVPYGLSTGRGLGQRAVWTSPDGNYLAVRMHEHESGSRRLRGGSLEIYDIGSAAALRLFRAPLGDASPADLDALDALDGASSDIIDLLRACLRYRFRGPAGLAG